MNESEMRARAEVAAKNSLDMGMILEDDPLLSGLLFLQSIAFSSVATNGLSNERMSTLEYLSARIKEVTQARLAGLLETIASAGFGLTPYEEALN